jgi:peptidyl-prolyl cis-trans isomerase C
MILAQTELSNTLTNTTVDPAEVDRFYSANRDRFKRVKVKAIYIQFQSGDSAAKEKKALTEEQAKAKAGRLLAELRKGADFSKLARESSDDEASRAKDGEFATVNPTDNIPDAMRAAVFELKEGEVSEPVRQPNGFYLFRADQVSYRPLNEVRDQIFTELKQRHYGDWMRGIDTATPVQYPSPAFLGKPAAPAPK